VLDADAVVGSGLACCGDLPAFGMVAGKRVRRRAQARL
jgi:hypothetical protein